MKYINYINKWFIKMNKSPVILLLKLLFVTLISDPNEFIKLIWDYELKK